LKAGQASREKEGILYEKISKVFDNQQISCYLQPQGPASIFHLNWHTANHRFLIGIFRGLCGSAGPASAGYLFYIGVLADGFRGVMLCLFVCYLAWP
jgi:hypothetical protein